NPPGEVQPGQSPAAALDDEHDTESGGSIRLVYGDAAQAVCHWLAGSSSRSLRPCVALTVPCHGWGSRAIGPRWDAPGGRGLPNVRGRLPGRWGAEPECSAGVRTPPGRPRADMGR